MVCYPGRGDLVERIVYVSECSIASGSPHSRFVVVVVIDLADAVDEVIVVVTPVLDRLVSSEVVGSRATVSPSPDAVPGRLCSVQRTVGSVHSLSRHSWTHVAQEKLEIVKAALRAAVSPTAWNPVADAPVLSPIAALITNLSISFGVLLVDEEGLEEPNPLEAILVSSGAHGRDEEGNSQN